MEGRKHTELRRLIERYDSKAHLRAMQMNALAVVGLIAFGVFAIPAFSLSTRALHKEIASQQEVPQTQAKVFPAVSIVAESALVYDLTTGTPIFEKNAQQIQPLASLTKLLTVYAALTSLPQDGYITLAEADLLPEGDSGLIAGETYSLDSLERLSLVGSSNDAAQAIASAVAKKQATGRNDLLASVVSALGLSHTSARNGTGLDISTHESGGYGSAHDVARLAGAIVERDPELARSSIYPGVTVRSREGRALYLENTNQSIRSIPNPLLSKTGFTDLAGGNLVVIFDAGIGHPVAVVVLGSTKEARFSDVRELVQKTLTYMAPASQSPQRGEPASAQATPVSAP